MEWRIYPLDVLFFRGMEPMNAGEPAVIQGHFPPSPEVMQGFVRTALLHALDVSFKDYAQAVQGESNGDPKAHQAVALLGRSSGDDLGQLDLRGPYLVRQHGNAVDRWYPAPLDMWTSQEHLVWQRGELGEHVESDLGSIRFLSVRGGEGAAGQWISQAGLEQYLRGEDVPVTQVAPSAAFYTEEQRVGIGRDPTSRTTREAMLYASSFVRLKDRDGEGVGPIGIGLRVGGIDAAMQRRCAGLHRLGGEGRLVALEVHDEPDLPQIVDIDAQCRIVVLTPARWGGSWLPPNFQRDAMGWRGRLDGHDLTIVSAAVGKPIRIGGWDIARARPKPAEACVPAGSVYFVQAETSLAALHDQTLGARRRAGFGHALLGRW